jgi:hypothetical protein
MVSEDSTSRVMVFPVTVRNEMSVDVQSGDMKSLCRWENDRSDRGVYSRVLTKICIVTNDEILVSVAGSGSLER